MAIKTGRVLFFLVMSGAVLFLVQFLQWKFFSPPSIDADDPNLSPLQMARAGESKPEVLVDKSRKSSRVDAIKVRSLGGPENFHLPVAGMKPDLGVAPRVMAEPKVKGLPQPALMGHKILELKKRDVSARQAPPLPLAHPRHQVPSRKDTAEGAEHRVNEKIQMEVMENRKRARNPRDPVHRRMDNSNRAAKVKTPSSQMHPRGTVREKEAQGFKNRRKQTARERQTNRDDLASLHRHNGDPNRAHYPLGRTYTESPRKDVKATRHSRVQRPSAYKKPLVIVSAPEVFAETDRKRSRT